MASDPALIKAFWDGYTGCQMMPEWLSPHYEERVAEGLEAIRPKVEAAAISRFVHQLLAERIDQAQHPAEIRSAIAAARLTFPSSEVKNR